MMKLRFFGANKTVTGSRHLLELQGKRYLIDCGLFQGYKDLRLRNWEPFPVDPSSIDSLLLTHAHIDHSGYIPRLVKQGFKGKIYCTPATHELCKIMLRDSAYLQEEDARYANRHKFSKHKPALPLYTKEDAERALNLFHVIDFHQTHTLNNAFEFTFYRAGHILGSAFIKVKGDGKTVIFSGDLGRMNEPVMKNPEASDGADYIVLESTYGDRLHEDVDTLEQMKEVILDSYSKGGNLLIPSFAVGRTQSLLFYIEELKRTKQIPNIQVYIDSPMATSATKLFCNYIDELRMTKKLCHAVCDSVIYTREVEESKALNSLTTPSIIISASGMATGGRVVHHMKHLIGNPENTILFTGYQAGGTRGDRLLKGEKEIKIHGEMHPVRASIKVLTNLSAHADYQEIIDWLKKFKTAPKKIFLTHGNEHSALFFAEQIKKELGWSASVPDYLQIEDL